jgi:peptidyl-prolyl cis-trans isomerase A (cyclophilin A)
MAPLLALLVLPAGLTAQTPDVPRVTMSTTLGEIVIEVDTIHAPITAGNFLRYVDAGLYDGGRFYRAVTMSNQPDDAVRIEVIQGGIAPDRRGDRLAPIPLERTSVTGLRHLDGTISVARAGPDTGSSEFFICVGDQPELDYGGARNPDGQGFAAFGRVVQGMDIVRRIHVQPESGQQLEPVVEITLVRKQ